MSIWCAWNAYGDLVCDGYSREEVERTASYMGYCLFDLIIARFNA